MGIPALLTLCHLLLSSNDYNLYYNSWEPHQVQYFVEPDVGPNCWQRLIADKLSVVGKELNE